MKKMLSKLFIALPSLLRYILKPHPQPLSLLKKRGDKAKLYLNCLRKRYIKFDDLNKY